MNTFVRMSAKKPRAFTSFLSSLVSLFFLYTFMSSYMQSLRNAIPSTILRASSSWASYSILPHLTLTHTLAHTRLCATVRIYILIYFSHGYKCSFFFIFQPHTRNSFRADLLLPLAHEPGCETHQASTDPNANTHSSIQKHRTRPNVASEYLYEKIILPRMNVTNGPFFEIIEPSISTWEQP